MIVCANVANLLFARGAARQREVAMRLALGARRSRLIRLLLTESVVLAVVGGALGLVVAKWSSALLLRFLAYGYDSLLIDFRPDVRLLSFTAGVTILAAAVFGIAPALRSSRLDLHDTLKGGSSGALGSGPVLRIGRTLVSAQVALSLLLLVTAGIFIRTAGSVTRSGIRTGAGTDVLGVSGHARVRRCARAGALRAAPEPVERNAWSGVRESAPPCARPGGGRWTRGMCRAGGTGCGEARRAAGRRRVL